MLRFDLFHIPHTGSTRYSSNPWLVVLILLLSCWLAIPGRAGAQNGIIGDIEIEPGGKIWFEGKASVVNYTCRAETLEGIGTIEDRAAPTQSIEAHGNVTVSVTIPVKTLDCGKRGMNRDMYEALKSEKHPFIRYHLIDANRIESDSNGYAESEGWMDIRTEGLLEIAGVTDTTEVTVQGKLLSPDRFRVKGKRKINMLDFDVDPPKAMLGLIRADKYLTVHFEVTVRLKE